MYEEENFSTFLEIRRIVEAKIRALLSRRMENFRWWDEMDIKSHSMIKVVGARQV